MAMEQMKIGTWMALGQGAGFRLLGLRMKGFRDLEV